MTTPLNQKESRKEDTATQQIAREAAEKLMQDRPYIGAGIDTDELAKAFLSAIERGIQAFLCDTSNPSVEEAAQPQSSKACKDKSPRAQDSPAK